MGLVFNSTKMDMIAIVIDLHHSDKQALALTETSEHLGLTLVRIL